MFQAGQPVEHSGRPGAPSELKGFGVRSLQVGFMITEKLLHLPVSSEEEPCLQKAFLLPMSHLSLAAWRCILLCLF